MSDLYSRMLPLIYSMGRTINDAGNIYGRTQGFREAKSEREKDRALREKQQTLAERKVDLAEKKFEYGKEKDKSLKEQRERETALAEKTEERKTAESPSNIAKREAEAKLKTEQAAASKFARSKAGRQFALDKIKAQAEIARGSAVDSQDMLQTNHIQDIQDRSRMYNAIKNKNPELLADGLPAKIEWSGDEDEE